MNFIIKGNIIYNKTLTSLNIIPQGYLICKEGVSQGVFTDVSWEYSAYPLIDYGDKLILPGLIDLHLHAPQYTFRGMGMDLELLDWLNTYTFKEESKYKDLDYAHRAYDLFVEDMVKGATTRAAIFGTIHTPATLLLMEKLEEAGIPSYVGKVNMDRNSPPYYIEESATKSLEETKEFIEETLKRFSNSKAILTPRFTPSCTDELMEGLGALQRKYHIPVQSHLSENPKEITWVEELCPGTSCYGDSYHRYGLFGGEGVPTIMAHCVWPVEIEEQLLKDQGVYVAHCPGSNSHLSSGIAPIRRFLNQGIKVGLASDVAGGTGTNILRAMADAIQMSKMYWRLVDPQDTPLTVPEVLYMATKGGGSFFGQVGSFEEGYEFDAIVIDDSYFHNTKEFTIENRLERLIYLGDEKQVYEKYIKGHKVKESKGLA